MTYSASNIIVTLKCGFVEVDIRPYVLTWFRPT